MNTNYHKYWYNWKFWKVERPIHQYIWAFNRDKKISNDNARLTYLYFKKIHNSWIESFKCDDRYKRVI